MQNTFNVRHLGDRPEQMMAALYLQVSIVSQALIFVTRSRSWSFVERPGLLLLGAFMVAQLVSILPTDTSLELYIPSTLLDVSVLYASVVVLFCMHFYARLQMG